jgi:Carboxypeptidase regulatory-like domain
MPRSSHAVQTKDALIFPRIKRALFKCVLVIAITQPSLPLVAQQSVRLADSQATLPDAPSQAHAGTQSPAIPSQQENGATLSGTVVDRQGAVLQGARVTISDPAGAPVRTVQSGIDGQFEFKGLQPNVYDLTVTAPGMSAFTSAQIPLRAGEFHILPPVTLSTSLVTTSTVTA